LYLSIFPHEKADHLINQIGIKYPIGKQRHYCGKPMIGLVFFNQPIISCNPKGVFNRTMVTKLEVLTEWLF